LTVTMCNESYPFRYDTDFPATRANISLNRSDHAACPEPAIQKIYTLEVTSSRMRL
jgi:hypothetical protein